MLGQLVGRQTAIPEFSEGEKTALWSANRIIRKLFACVFIQTGR